MIKEISAGGARSLHLTPESANGDDECVTSRVYLKQIVKITMFLQAHLQCRKTDSYLENAKFEEAVACHEKAIG